MRRLQPRNIVAMALEEEAAAATDTPVEAIGDNAESLETDLIEVTDDAAAQTEEAAATDEAAEVVEALESIAEAMAISAANGGMDKHSAAIVGIATEHMYARVGLRTSSMPALESFGGTSSRVGATKLAMEDIKEQAAKLWKYIVDAFKRAIQWAVDFYNKIFGAWEKLEKRADALEKKADGITGTAKEKTFENERLAKALHIGGSIPSAMAAEVKKLQEIAKPVFTGNVSAAEMLSKVAEKMNTAGAEKTFIAEFNLSTMTDGGNMKEVSNAEAAGFNAPKEGLVIKRSEELLGGMALIAREPKSELKGQAAVDAISGVSIGIAKFDPKGKEPSKKDLPVLTTSACTDLAKAISTLATEGRAYRNTMGKIAEQKKKLVATAEKLGKDAGGAEGDGVAGFKAMQKVATQLARLADQPAATVSVYSLNTGKAVLDYVEESLKQYKGDK